VNEYLFNGILNGFTGRPWSGLRTVLVDSGYNKTASHLRHIFISGNFGRFDANGCDHSKTTYLKRKWRSFRYQSSRLFKLFSLFPRYISGYAWGWFCGAVGRVVKGR
jgi:hypothetical protein